MQFGLVLVAAGIVLGIVQPTISAHWASDESRRQKWGLGVRD
jgi:hypothetical protein